MDLRTAVDIAAPTPFGWVITTPSDSDLSTILSFRGQLASLSKYFENQKSDTEIASEAKAEVDEEMLQPVYVRSR
jgi:hypothetical protein